MPNKQSAKRRVRIEERNRAYNRYWTTRCKNVVKKLIQATKSDDKEGALKIFNTAQSVIDKAVVKGVMHRNTATRRKQMMARCLKTMGAAD